MKFKANSRRRALEYEKDLVQYWKQHKTFEKSVSQRPADNSYVFYDGPPFITGVPHHGTLLSSIVKDAVPRYQTMKGKRVERVWGWDCHGLPAEVFTEKKLGIRDRRDIGTKISLEEYINTARDNMVQTGSLWEDTIDRIGRWVDFKGAYKTMDKEYMESIWWAFKTLYEKGKIYEGERVLMYCTRDATPLSKAEVTMDAGAYQDVTDPSAYVKFKLTQNDMTHAEIAIEKIDLESDYSRFASETGLDRQYASRLERMTKEDKAVVFAAKIGTDYVGRVTLWLDEWKDEDGGSDDDRKVPSDDYPGLPQINALQVLRAFRRRGVATALLHAAEQEAARRGFKTVGLGVGIDNSPASELYTKQGYKKYPVDQKDTYWARWQETDNSGGVRQISHECYFMLKDISRADGVYLLAWTTTPWTLPANVALAVNPDLTYVEVEYAGERLIFAKDLVGKVLTNEKHQALEHTLTRELKGGELVGLEYEPLFEDRGAHAHRVLSADFVSAEEGTGIVHIAPAYGEDDFNLAREHDLPVVHTIDENGLFTSGDWAGENVWEINKTIAKTLLERGVVWKIEYIRHPYPHCHRCGTRLMYRAHPSWFMDIEGQREEMLARNTEEITWFPEHIKHGRFEKNIQAAPDWNLSRDRFWATAMPVWEGVDAAGNKQQIVVGSYAELKELSGVELEDYHRPWIDAVEFERDGVHYKRIDKVIDGWFESGSMPFAQFHYPFENKEKFEANFPGDFIAEYVGQVRAWFYYLHAVNVGLFGKSAFKNVIVTGTLAGNDGRKMSKSYGNFTDPNELMDTYSADSLRFLLLSSPVLNAEDFSLQDKDVGDVARKLSMIWNMYDFFTMYAEVDKWEWNGDLSDPSPQLTNPLDQWVVSRVHQLTQEVEQHMDRYDIPSALKPVLPFIEDASNWYVRRSRRRFWKSEDDTDKNNAYRTLHYVLVQLSQVLAPFTPFLAEELYRKLTGGESVHLLDWPRVGHVNELLLDEMDSLRDFVQMGLSERAIHKTKIRQPLRALTYYSKEQPLRAEFEEILKDELNVHEVIHSTSVKGLTELSQIVGRVDCSVELDLVITPELRREGVMREVIRHVQAARKNAGLNVDDRIHLVLTSSDEELQRAIIEHKSTIMAETLALELADTGEPAYTATVQIDGSSLTIGLEKA